MSLVHINVFHSDSSQVKISGESSWLLPSLVVANDTRASSRAILEMKQIPLSQSKKCKYAALKLFALVDDSDYEFLNQRKWQLKKNYQTWYAVSKGVRMHRLILGLTDRNIFADHRDRNGLNNQRENLRIATRSQNTANVDSKKGTSSKYLGVCRIRRTRNGKVYSYWAATVVKNRKCLWRKTFKDEDMAARAYDQKAIEVHGEFANVNFK